MSSDPLVACGWNAVSATFPQDIETPGRIVRVDRGLCLVTTHDGTVRASVAVDAAVVTGDWVGVDLTAPGGPQIDRLIDRTTVIERYDTSLEIPQPLAANVDVVLVVHGLDLKLKLRRMERTLVIVHDGGARPVVVLSKADVIEGGPEGTQAAFAEAEFRDIAGDVDVIILSAMTGYGMATLRSHITPGQTVLVLGESGVGKSTLINTLAGDDIRDTGPTRVGDSRGRHTTTERELIPLPSGVILLDTPGVRTLGLWDAAEGLATAFADLTAAAETCRFRDCRHDDEPGCGVREAIDRGDLAAERVTSYRRLEAEITSADRRAISNRVAKRGKRRGPKRDTWRRDWD